jgi:hypothetical protein
MLELPTVDSNSLLLQALIDLRIDCVCDKADKVIETQ